MRTESEDFEGSRPVGGGVSRGPGRPCLPLVESEMALLVGKAIGFYGDLCLPNPVEGSVLQVAIYRRLRKTRPTAATMAVRKA